MYALGGVELSAEPRITQELQLSGVDNEALLVSFLGELLFLWEQHQQAFDCFEFERKDQYLKARAEGAPIKNAARLIKAVTYHHLKIEYRGGVYYTHLVFDL
jgi:SHS2 domain-containing protein